LASHSRALALSAAIHARLPMPGPALVETAGWVVGLAGVSWLTFTSVSFLEIKRKYEGEDAWTPAPKPPPAQKKAASGAPTASTGATPSAVNAKPAPRGFKAQPKKTETGGEAPGKSA
jgi:hypothetical protein